MFVVGAADRSLALDRKIKQAIYARSGIGAYRSVNLQGGGLEIQRDPEGGGNPSWVVRQRECGMWPRAGPDRAVVAAADLLP